MQEVGKAVYCVSLGAPCSDAFVPPWLEECRQAPRLNVRSVERNVAAGAQGTSHLLVASFSPPHSSVLALIPANVKEIVMEEIRQFIEDNLQSSKHH